MWLSALVCTILIRIIICSEKDFLDPGELVEDPDRPLHISQASGVHGGKGSLACDVTDPSTLALVFWFKDSSTDPIYSIDIRNGTPSPWSSPELLGPRASYTLTATTAALNVNPVKENDAGLYTCRVDYTDKPTRNSRINFTVIGTVPPDRPVIWDIGKGDKPLPPFGPYDEGDDITLACRVLGGEPLPRVIWQLNDITFDESFDNFPNSNISLNKLKIQNLTRRHSMAKLSCLAINNDLEQPLTVDMVLDINLRPLSVEILTKEPFVSAERRYDIECRSIGSRPPAKITWLKRNRPLTNMAVEYIEDNSTVSVLSLVSSIADDGAYITCRANNPKMKNSAIEDKWRLNVKYSPIVNISLGSGLKQNDIREGDDVYINCEVKGNPKPERISWHKDKDVLLTNAEVNQSSSKLILDKITAQQSGVYKCTADNSEGRGVSSDLTLRVRYVPKCVSSYATSVGILKSESIQLKCDVCAHPLPKQFTWKLVNGIQSKSLNFSDQTIMYTIKDVKEDYGLLKCFAENDVGVQTEPCRFRLLPIGFPAEPQNCSIVQIGATSAIIGCREDPTSSEINFNYIGVATETDTFETVEETSSSNSSLTFVHLEPAKTYDVRISTANIRGVSESSIIKITTLNPEIRLSSVTLLWYSLMGSIICLGVVISAAIWWWCAKPRRKKRIPSHDEVSLEPREVQAASLLITERNSNHITTSVGSPRHSSHSEGFVDCADESLTPEQILTRSSDVGESAKDRSLDSRDRRSLEDVARNYRNLLGMNRSKKTDSIGSSTSNVGVTCRLGSAPSPFLAPHRFSSVGILRESYI